MKTEDLERLFHKGLISDLDRHFARFLARMEGRDVPELSLGAALVSSRTREGHICLDLATEGGKALLEGDEVQDPIVSPAPGDWHSKLGESTVVGRPGERKPLILDEKSRLYLYRYWDYQEKLADLIKRRLGESSEHVDTAVVKEGLERLFPGDSAEEVDWQRVAAYTAVRKKFCVISGGPGTGKTTTVARILAMLLEQAGGEGLRVGIAAPTGKAAARLQETIKGGGEKLNCSERIKSAIPEEASTIHRLLGTVPNSPYFRHNAVNNLPLDVLVVDEASMVDMALMSKLIQALPPESRLILLGDKDQLASVEAGAVLGDICDTGNAHTFSQGFRKDLEKVTGYRISGQPGGEREHGIGDGIVQLQRSYRFGAGSGISAASRAVNQGKGALAVEAMKGGEYSDTGWRELPPSRDLARNLKETVVQGYGDYLRAGDPVEIFERFERFRILCALRKGPFGVAAVNGLVEEILEGNRLIDRGREWYPGRPVLITSNDYNLRLFNGDVGMVLPDPGAKGELRVFFPDGEGTLRKFHPVRLPEHETVFAMTIHKSQGSEFDRVLLLLPDRAYPVLTRELIYTGLTRARDRVEVWATEEVFLEAVSRRIKRTSGLRDALWPDPSSSPR